MRKIIMVGLFSILIAFSSHAQRNYSMENLEQVSQERLDVLLNRAKTKRTIAAVLTGVGVTAILTGIIGGRNGGAEVLAIFPGTIMTLIVLPVTIINSSRVQKVQGVMNSRNKGVFLEIAPYRFQNNVALSHQSGMSLSIKF